MRWLLAPILLLFAAIFFIPLLEAIDEQRQAGVISTSLVITLCFTGALTLWGVPLVDRIASGIIALAFGCYLVDQCLINFDGTWGFGGSRAEASPINSIFGFLIFGLPALLHTIFGRFTLRRKLNVENSFTYPDLYKMSPEQAEQLEADFGVKFPEDYRNLITDGYPLDGFSEEFVNSESDLREQNNAFRNEGQWGFRWEDRFWWIGGDGAGGFYFINTDEDSSEVYYVDHEDPAKDFDDRERLFSSDIGNHLSDIVEIEQGIKRREEQVRATIANRRWWQF